MSAQFDTNDLKRRMQGAILSLRHELAGLRTGRASANLVEPVQVQAYGQSMPLNQVASISVPEARTLGSPGMGQEHGQRRRQGDP